MSRQPGVVYILDTGVGMKIGITSRDLSSRMKELSPVYTLLFVHAIGYHHPKELEKWLHEKFRDKRVPHLPSREIFSLTLDDVEWIKRIEKFQGRPVVHLDTLLDASKYTLASVRRFYMRGR